MTLRAGFIGLGNIGQPMARRLLAAGLETRVHDLADERVRELVAAGAKASTSPRDLAASSDYVGVCVRDDAELRAVTLGPDGILAGAAPGVVVAVHSTVQPATVLALAERGTSRRVHFVDACISGGSVGAAQGTLTVMAGGDPEHLERIRPALEAFAQKIVHAGALGSGTKLKLCNNLMTYLAWTAAYEAMLLARASGLSQEVLEAVTRSTGNLTDPMLAFLALHKAPEETRHGERFQALMRGFVALAEKDLAATLSLAEECQVTLPGTAAAARIMARVYGLDEGEGR
jgi:3-hydroxyisobutyrate dehydrogenase-like beta-hydroxyacid dehydrogenase